MRNPLSTLAGILLIVSITLSSGYAISYPVGTPSGETANGTFNTYFTNMFTTNCGTGLFVYGFDNLGNKNCGSIPAAAVSNSTLALSGALIGTPNYVAKYTPTGTGINISQIYDTGTGVGIGMITP